MSRRFWFVIDKGNLEYVRDNVTKEEISVTGLEDLLNELSDENEALREQVKNRNACEKRFIYILKKYPFYEGSRTLFVSDNLEKTLAEYEKIEKKQGYGYTIEKYPLNMFSDDYHFGETVKHQEFRENGLCEWNGDDWGKL